MRALLVACAAMLVFCNFCNENTPGNAGDARAPVPRASAPSSIAPADEAKQIAQTRCAMCHGQGGKGDGPNGMTLNPKPQDLTTKDWQKSVSDAQVRSVILKGGPALGKSPLMPSNPDLESKPAVADELVKLVRAYAQ